MSPQRTIAAVDLRPDLAIALIGLLSEGAPPEILGLGVTPMRGMAGGLVRDFPTVREAVAGALSAAERLAGGKAEHAWLTARGPHLAGHQSEATLRVTTVDRRISAAEMEAACALAKDHSLPPERAIISQVRQTWRLDGRLQPHSPENLHGSVLGVAYWTLHGDNAELSARIHAVADGSREVVELLPAGLAAGMEVLTAAERCEGALVVDLAPGTADYALFLHGVPFATGSVAADATPETLLARVRQSLGTVHPAEFCRAGAVLTGTDLAKYREVAAGALRVPVRVAESPVSADGAGLRGSGLSAALGLLRLAAQPVRPQP